MPRCSAALQRDGLAIYRFGEGPAVLLMPYPHAATVVGDASFQTLVSHLARPGRQVVTFDPPGSGRSTRPARLNMPEMLDCARQALGASGLHDQLDVFGHSQGGLVALALALEHPQRVRRLVLACTASGGPAYMNAPGAIWNRTHPDHWWMGGWGLAYLLTGRRAPAMHMLNVIFRASWVDRSRFVARPVSLGDWLRPAPPRLAWAQEARGLDYSTRLGQVCASTLVLAGIHDPQMPPSCGEDLARGIPNARLAVFEQSGHYPFVEQADRFWAEVNHFLR